MNRRTRANIRFMNARAEAIGAEFFVFEVLSFLDGYELARAREVSRLFHRMASQEALWAAACKHLWADKTYVPQQIREMLPRQAFPASLRDSHRSYLKRAELTSFFWSFRFKRDAGESWTQLDPWWRGQPAATSSFRPDGTIVRLDHDGATSLPTFASFTWRAVPSSAGRRGPKGSFIRARINGRDVPTYVVSRCPRTWGFVMQSCWAVHTSWRMAPRPPVGPAHEADSVEGGLVIHVDDQWDEMMTFNTGLPTSMFEDASEATFTGDGWEEEEVEGAVPNAAAAAAAAATAVAAAAAGTAGPATGAAAPGGGPQPVIPPVGGVLAEAPGAA